MVFTTQGMRGPLLAIRLGQKGTLSSQADVVWQDRQGTPDTCCPVVWDDLLFTVADNGVAVCYDALPESGIGNSDSAATSKPAPWQRHGRIYFVAKDGLTTVIAAKSEFEKLADEPARRRNAGFAGRQRQANLPARTEAFVLSGRQIVSQVMSRSRARKTLVNVTASTLYNWASCTGIIDSDRLPPERAGFINPAT